MDHGAQRCDTQRRSDCHNGDGKVSVPLGVRGLGAVAGVDRHRVLLVGDECATRGGADQRTRSGTDVDRLIDIAAADLHRVADDRRSGLRVGRPRPPHGYRATRCRFIAGHCGNIVHCGWQIIRADRLARRTGARRADVIDGDYPELVLCTDHQVPQLTPQLHAAILAVIVAVARANHLVAGDRRIIECGSGNAEGDHSFDICRTGAGWRDRRIRNVLHRQRHISPHASVRIPGGVLDLVLNARVDRERRIGHRHRQPATVVARYDRDAGRKLASADAADIDHPKRPAGEWVGRRVVGEHVNNRCFAPGHDSGVRGRLGQWAPRCDHIQRDSPRLAFAQVVPDSEDQRRRRALDRVFVCPNGQDGLAQRVAEARWKWLDDRIGEFVDVVGVGIVGELEQVELFFFSRLKLDDPARENRWLVYARRHCDGQYECGRLAVRIACRTSVCDLE